MKGALDLSLLQIGYSFVYVLVVLLIVKIRKLNREKEILLSTVRMSIQLVLAGYVLVYVLKNPSPIITGSIILLMEVFAVYTIFKKFKGKLSKALKKTVILSIIIGTLSALFYFILVIIQISPWYDPQYFVPIAGMLIGNSMTGVVLALNSLIEGMTTKKSLVEEALILGATPKKATNDIINNTFDASIIPTINSMIGMGIVFLPGMMTGLILSGTSPTTAIAYQIAIMFGILGAVSITVILTLQLGYRTFFNKHAQLIDGE